MSGDEGAGQAGGRAGGRVGRARSTCTADSFLYHRSGSFICFTHFDGVWNETSIDEPSTRRALSSSQPEHVHCAADEHSLSPIWCIAVLSIAGTTNEPLGVYLHSPPNCAGAPTRHVSPSQ